VTVCPRDELARELAAGNRFVRRVMDDSVVIYTRESA
jgi:hypothetical protein